MLFAYQKTIFKCMEKLSDQDILNRVYIAAPCSVPWDSMEGNERIRHCQQCKLNVYNVAELSSKETANLIRKKEGRLCLKIYRRRDGTIITDNCPVGLRRIRNGLKTTVAAVVTVAVSIGFMDNASAQGLVGAPVNPKMGQYSGTLPSPAPEQDPRYKESSGEVGSLTEARIPERIDLLAVLVIPALLLFGFLIKNRATMFMTSIFLAVIVFAAGFLVRLFQIT